MTYNYDLIIVGGGPAGSTMALYAAKHGLKVLLVDKEQFPRDKICGDALPTGCFSILQELHLIDALLLEPHRRASAVWYSEYESLRFPNSGDAILSRRIIFDNVLFQAAKACADTQEGLKVENLLVKDGQVFGIQGTSQSGKSFEYTAKVVAGADGCSSVVARKLGLRKPNNQNGAVGTRAYYRHLPVSNEIEFHYLQECIPGYFWIFPVDDDTVNVGVLFFGNALKDKNISSQDLHRRLVQSPLLKERFEQAELIGNIQGWHLPMASVRRTMHGNGFILAGDAAGLIDPLDGHGIDRAMTSGKIAGEILGAVCRGNDHSAKALQQYADAVWNRFGPISKLNHDFRNRLQLPPFTFPLMTQMGMLNTFYSKGSGTLAKRPALEISLIP